MPPTVTSFQSGPEVVSTIGGSGEGLNCSLPRLANYFFDRSEYDNGNRHLVLQRFRQACVFHDLCYRHGLATYGYNQNDCDRSSAERGVPALPVYPNGSRSGRTARCQTDSKMILAGVSLRRLRRLSCLGPVDLLRIRSRSLAFERIFSQPGGRSSLQIRRSRQVSRRPGSNHSDVRECSDPTSPLRVSPARKYRSSRRPAIATTSVPNSARSD